ncbi:hypothetical protein [Cohnella panacarvi]|uniref:hypothetical protein n=1 Tax=Cohnella panacarvi TaxID=400776 RepID=UPI00047EB32C|nr:hypothetical protein [Cohnella panacarvi]
MTYWRKHAAIPVLIAAIVLIGAMAYQFYRMKDDGMFVLKDLSGDRKTLDDVVISGQLGDGFHRTSWRLDEGRIDTNTELFKQPIWPDTYRYIPGGNKRIGNTEFRVGGNREFNIMSYERPPDKNDLMPIRTAYVTPSIRYGKSSNGNAVTYANPLEYGIARIGGKVYFTVPAAYDSTGTSGIYELSFVDWGISLVVDKQDYPARTVVEVPLETNVSGQSAGIDVLGLEAVGNKLVLISVENHALKLRSYDGASGELFGEATVPNFYLPGRPGTPSGANTYQESYEAFVDEGRSALNLSFMGSSIDHRFFLNFDLSTGVKLIDTVTVAFDDGDFDPYRGFYKASYKNGRFYILRAFRDARMIDNEPYYDLALPQHCYLYVYERSELVYKGELATDMNDDNVEMLSVLPSANFSYDQMDYRFFSKITIE